MIKIPTHHLWVPTDAAPTDSSLWETTFPQTTGLIISRQRPGFREFRAGLPPQTDWESLPGVCVMDLVILRQWAGHFPFPRGSVFMHEKRLCTLWRCFGWVGHALGSHADYLSQTVLTRRVSGDSRRWRADSWPTLSGHSA